MVLEIWYTNSNLISKYFTNLPTCPHKLQTYFLIIFNSK